MSDSAIFTSFFPKKAPKLFLSIGLFLVLLSSIFVPSGSDGPLSGLLSCLVAAFPGFLLDGQTSIQPAHMVLTSAAVVFLPVVIALLICFCEIDMLPLHRLQSERGAVSRVVVFVFLVLILACQIFISVGLDDLSFSRAFMQEVENSRFLLAVWACSIFLMNCLFWLLVFFDFAYFVCFLFGVKNEC